jgi:hypothetical protein
MTPRQHQGLLRRTTGSGRSTPWIVGEVAGSNLCAVIASWGNGADVHGATQVHRAAGVLVGRRGADTGTWPFARPDPQQEATDGNV